MPIALLYRDVGHLQDCGTYFTVELGRRPKARQNNKQVMTEIVIIFSSLWINESVIKSKAQSSFSFKRTVIFLKEYICT